MAGGTDGGGRTGWWRGRRLIAPVGACCAALLVSAALAAVLHPAPAAGGRGAPPPSVPVAEHRAPAPAARPVPPTSASPTIAAVPSPAPPAEVPLVGCPPPPFHGPPGAPPWHPANLVPDAQLPQAPAAPRRVAPVAALRGKGMWIWQMSSSDHGDVAAIVADARRAGLRQLWVRVGDSKDGFYGGPSLDQLVPAAHAGGLAVIAWGFPYLFDPAADAAWTESALAWSSPSGDRLDGFSADVETADEGVALSPQRTQVYLGLVRRADPRALLVATVFPPNNHFWTVYPYASMAPYVDAFAPMVYWGCDQPGADAAVALRRLGPLAPVHLIGQAYSMGDVGGRQPAPSAQEISTFLSAGRSGGALGASFWSWQSMDPEEWSALTGFGW